MIQMQKINNLISQPLKKQAGSAVPFFIIPSGIGSTSGAKRIFRHSLGDMLAYFRNEFCAWYFPEIEVKKSVSFFWKKVLADKNYILKAIKQSRDKRKELKVIYRQINNLEDNKINKEEIIQIYKKLYKIYQNYWNLCSWIDIFDDEGEVMLSGFLSEHRKQIQQTKVNKYLDALLTPSKISYSQKEENDFFEIAKMVKKNKKLMCRLRSGQITVDELNKNFKLIYRGLTNHGKKYFWYANDYAKVYNLDISYFIKRLQKILINYSEFETRVFQVDAKRKKMFFQKNEFSEKISYKFKKFLWLLNILTMWRDERKEVTMVQASYFKKVLEMAGRITGVSYNNLIYLNNYELDLVFTDPKIWSERLAKRRLRGYMYFMPVQGNNFNIEGKIVNSLYKKFEVSFVKKGKLIRGMSAQVGRAIGKVKVINTSAELNRMEKGDILVAPMTRPEYITAMRMARAIITDQGGITCHAAIVARELGIPCVIGTKIATKALKDGDRVEVDANEGTITILNKKHD